ncbi:sigma-70 family RNA polymerase sigma factor [Candidatus Woesearchaeota archaeon]|nr:sigma-70 family RNA polymerase sigma factor [Candidatus Woesearchaeota archaeon]
MLELTQDLIYAAPGVKYSTLRQALEKEGIVKIDKNRRSISEEDLRKVNFELESYAQELADTWSIGELAEHLRYEPLIVTEWARKNRIPGRMITAPYAKRGYFRFSKEQVQIIQNDAALATRHYARAYGTQNPNLELYARRAGIPQGSVPFSEDLIKTLAPSDMNWRSLQRLLENSGLLTEQKDGIKLFSPRAYQQVRHTIDNYVKLSQATFSNDEAAGMSGMDESTMRRHHKLGNIHGYRLLKPFSTKYQVRWSRQEIQNMIKVTSQLSMEEIHTLSLYARIPISEDRLKRYFEVYQHKARPDIHAIPNDHWRYSRAYANRFLRSIGKLFDVDIDTSHVILKTDYKRAENLDPELLLQSDNEEFLFQIALFTRTHRQDDRIPQIIDHFAQRYIQHIAKKTRSTKRQARESVDGGVWNAFNSYDLYSGVHFMEFFDKHIRTEEAAFIRNEYTRYNEQSIQAPLGKTEDFSLENILFTEDKEHEYHDLYQALDRIDEHKREIIRLHFIEELDAREIAETLVVEIDHVEELIADSIEHLRLLML